MQLRAAVERWQPGVAATHRRVSAQTAGCDLPQHTDGIGAALLAVGHLRHHLAALFPDAGYHRGIRLRLAIQTKYRAVFGAGNQRHNIMNKRTAGTQFAADVRQRTGR